MREHVWQIAWRRSLSPVASRPRSVSWEYLEEILASLSADAATQWTGTCNPRPFDAQAALALYERAFQR